ncbi:hypothetical protein PFISCL1PPCAC_24718, partial [Pristionchus fissidentatus]
RSLHSSLCLLLSLIFISTMALSTLLFKVGVKGKRPMPVPETADKFYNHIETLLDEYYNYDYDIESCTLSIDVPPTLVTSTVKKLKRHLFLDSYNLNRQYRQEDSASGDMKGATTISDVSNRAPGFFPDKRPEARAPPRPKVTPPVTKIDEDKPSTSSSVVSPPMNRYSICRSLDYSLPSLFTVSCGSCGKELKEYGKDDDHICEENQKNGEYKFLAMNCLL